MKRYHVVVSVNSEEVERVKHGMWYDGKGLCVVMQENENGNLVYYEDYLKENSNVAKPESRYNVLADGWRDDLPDDNKDVIIASKTHSGVGWYDKYSKEWKIRAVYFKGPVTHWQPLPFPPTVS